MLSVNCLPGKGYEWGYRSHEWDEPSTCRPRRSTESRVRFRASHTLEQACSNTNSCPRFLFFHKVFQIEPFFFHFYCHHHKAKFRYIKSRLWQSPPVSGFFNQRTPQNLFKSFFQIQISWAPHLMSWVTGWGSQPRHFKMSTGDSEVHLWWGITNPNNLVSKPTSTIASPPQWTALKHLFEDLQSHPKFPAMNRIVDSWLSPTDSHMQFRSDPSLSCSVATLVPCLAGICVLGLGLTPSPPLACPHHPNTHHPSLPDRHS